jgi:nucleoside-diphosphate-sugar epimerase
MIIGNGLIAKSLKNIDTENYLYFASGVSNSLETRSSEFEREFSLLKNSIIQHKENKLFYFSTLSVNDLSKQQSPYVLHKLEIENFIKENCKNYIILRVGNIVGKGGNPNTLFNFLKTQIIQGSNFMLHQKARRLLLDIDDITEFLESNSANVNNQTINFAYPYYYDLKEIVEAIRNKLQKEANYQESDEGDFYKVDFDESVNDFFRGIDAENYLKNLAEKYI